MNLLAIDTSTEKASVALVYNGCMTCKEEGAQRAHAQLLLPMIEQLLSEATISLHQLDGIVFGRGPGSFTGLRIACSIAKGLAWANDLPVFPVSTLAAIANEAKQQHPEACPGSILSVIDARMNQLYWSYSNSTDEQVSSASDIVINGNEPFVLAGIGFADYRNQLSESVLARVSAEIEAYPSASAMLRLVLSGNILAITADKALPLYLRNQVVHGVSHG